MDLDIALPILTASMIVLGLGYAAFLSYRFDRRTASEAAAQNIGNDERAEGDKRAKEPDRMAHASRNAVPAINRTQLKRRQAAMRAVSERQQTRRKRPVRSMDAAGI